MKKTVTQRIEDLKAAHPNIVMEVYGTESGWWIKCIVPVGYCIQLGHVQMNECYDFSSHATTYTGAKRIVGKLERMEWWLWDEIAARAKEQKERLMTSVA